MPLAKLPVADAAPVIAFARIGQLALLPKVLGEVLVPETVACECLVPGLPGAETIAGAFAASWLIRTADADGDNAAFPQLDAGEAAAIHLSLKTGAMLLIDEKIGRAVARRLGLAVVGSLGVLITARQRGLVPSIAGLIKQMRLNGYYIAESLVREALLRAGEGAD